jgi:recombination protein RecA
MAQATSTQSQPKAASAPTPPPAAMPVRPQPSAEKLKALDVAVSAIEKQFGKGSIMRLGENQSIIPSIEVVPTGSMGLDLALGVGGLPRGRIIEIFGPESSGKTTLTLQRITE